MNTEILSPEVHCRRAALYAAAGADPDAALEELELAEVAVGDADVWARIDSERRRRRAREWA